MDLRQAIEYLVNLDPSKVFEIDGRSYSNKKLNLVTEPYCTPLGVTSLQGVVDYLVDVPVEEELFIHIDDFNEVFVRGPLNPDFNWPSFIRAYCPPLEFNFGQFYPLEEFIIAIKSQFIDPPEDLLKAVAFVKAHDIAEITDDGISQSLKVNSGIKAGNVDVDLKGAFTLQPYRTFREIEQPASEFVLRVKKEPQPRAALFEADGGVWKLEAVGRIKQYLAERTDVKIVA